MTPRWSAEQIPDQTGRTAVVTGANSGLGFVTSRELARAGAHVVMGCRDATRGDQARERLLQQVPSADVEVRALDLASLASVRVRRPAARRRAGAGPAGQQRRGD